MDAKPPFDFDKSLRFIERFRPMNGEQETSGKTLTKALMFEGQTVAMRLGEEPGGKPGVYYELFSERQLSERLAQKVAERVSFFLGLRDDLAPFYAIAAKDPAFYPVAKRLVGLHHVKFPSLFEITCWAILAQRSQMPVAKRAKDALTERFGGSIEVDGKVYRAFPDYEALRGAKVADVLFATKNRRNAERISILLSTFGELDEEFLLTAPYEKAEERLKRIKGIGDWSAQFILFRGLGRIEKLKYNMRPVEKMMGKLYGSEMTLDEVNRTYGEWSGYWSVYLWGSVMASPDEESTD
jgi:DNA-3-methyladenine glycosylase II